MPHGSPLVTILVIGLGLAFILGTVASRLGCSVLVGYLLAGIIIGPFTPGFVADQELVPQLAEIGVILLMFGVGLHFSVNDLVSVRAIAIPGAVVQVILSTICGMLLGHLLGWSWGSSVVFGMTLAIASTVVLLRTLQEYRLMDTQRGHIAIGWLVIQDLLTVMVLVLLPVMAPLLKHDPHAAAPDAWQLVLAVGLTIGKVAAFIALMMIVGRRLIPMMLHYVAHTGSRELFRLCVLAIALGVALTATEIFGVSFALGAFVAGMVLSESPLSQHAGAETLPLRDAFAVLFFISVGMLFNPGILLHHPLPLVGTLGVIMVATPVLTVAILRLLRQPWQTALSVGAGLAQIGEFSFILAALGVQSGLLVERARDLVLGASILSILLNPVMVGMVNRVNAMLDRRALLRAGGTAREDPTAKLQGHAVLIGCGRVGSLVAEGLRAHHIPLLVVEEADMQVRALRERGLDVMLGNATDPGLMQLLGLDRARILIVAIPDAFEAGEIIQQARGLSPELDIVARAHFDSAADYLSEYGASLVIMGEREIARAMLDYATHGTASGARVAPSST
ncbi:Kef family K(+) transporter [Gluconacetobacter entanii]|uniref:YbaL family putative K(+) efflux transporter n=1 Tax=Gluconacetobacter entanii TaxID=108528 RepID=UPI00187B2C1E|nr:YbaL family putative K(+) efflux transporter [Gluconacetobacter entanii]MBE7618085.1 Kef family K(+) transporter [Komagataeibacter sp. FXV2]MCE2577729.1 Kef family K(+) transporter [Komagataeibacter sp. FNDCR1]MBY4641593.1 Kef family K(+) transporter [Gluconacetobacter entanii]MCW4579373.1 Kef family K(+) transporter [Gluconacetobacter entanii]MCW4582747.1 Kef family K(+) transporter [Gluconacetobacter entanii]